MTLESLTEKYNLNPCHIKAFFLGTLNAQRPMNFEGVMEEFFEDKQEYTDLIPNLKSFWEELKGKKTVETQNLFSNGSLEESKDKLDQFLTALSLSGTHSDSVDEEVGELIEELEDTIEDLEEYLSEDNPSNEEGEELKELLLDTWRDFLATKNF